MSNDNCVLEERKKSSLNLTEEDRCLHHASLLEEIEKTNDWLNNLEKDWEAI